MKRNETLWNLLFAFMKVSFFTFGGGYAMISLIDHECVEKRKWITADEFMSILESSDNYNLLANEFSVLTAYEGLAAARAREGALDTLYEIIECGSLLRSEKFPFDDLSKDFSGILSNIIPRIKAIGLTNNEKAMVIRYFGGLYFSYAQALQIDAALETAFQLTDDNTTERDILIGFNS